MAELVIACLSQKGGVGKSSIARLIARTYASAGWSVKIADFNTRQLTSVKWAEMRAANSLEPKIQAEPFTQVKAMRRDPVDLVVADGKPDSDQSSLDIARAADLIILPTGLALDDLGPQILFGKELVSKGIDQSRIIFVLNKVVESEATAIHARNLLRERTGFRLAGMELTAKAGYQNAQNTGRALSETNFPTLNERADALAAEIVQIINALGKAA